MHVALTPALHLSPAGQGMQMDQPALEYYPSGQIVEALLEVLVQKLIAGHREHVDCPPVLYVP